MRLLWILFLVSFSFAQEVQVSADNFSADEIKGVGEFDGHVVITKGKDVLKSDKLIINFDKKRRATKYEATGNASVDVFINDKNYFGKGKSLIYNPVKNIYIIQGNAFLQERTTDKKVYGEKIVVNQKSGKYEVSSDNNRPVKFIFQVNDNSFEKLNK